MTAHALREDDIVADNGGLHGWTRTLENSHGKVQLLLDVCKTECMSQSEKKKDNTNHYNLPNVFESTVCNATILNSVAHKSEDLSQLAAKHLHLENISQKLKHAANMEAFQM